MVRMTVLSSRLTLLMVDPHPRLNAHDIQQQACGSYSAGILISFVVVGGVVQAVLGANGQGRIRTLASYGPLNVGIAALTMKVRIRIRVLGMPTGRSVVVAAAEDGAFMRVS